MENLHDLTEEFCSLLKTASESEERAEALLMNLKIVHHQLKNSKIDINHPELSKLLYAAAMHVSNAIDEVTAVSEQLVSKPAAE